MPNPFQSRQNNRTFVLNFFFCIINFSFAQGIKSLLVNNNQPIYSEQLGDCYGVCPWSENWEDRCKNTLNDWACNELEVSGFTRMVSEGNYYVFACVMLFKILDCCTNGSMDCFYKGNIFLNPLLLLGSIVATLMMQEKLQATLPIINKVAEFQIPELPLDVFKKLREVQSKASILFDVSNVITGLFCIYAFYLLGKQVWHSCCQRTVHRPDLQMRLLPPPDRNGFEVNLRVEPQEDAHHHEPHS